MTETIPTRSNLTPTESRIMALLIDGRCHPIKELLKCLDDDQATDTALRMHVMRMRQKLVGHDIYSRINGNGTQYQLVRLVGNYNE